ncbi:MAG: trypsin-like peptidase domain-containing protein [Coriobacteriia bacterium]|nr:trypsin-like peptidase domain-containing protein [Coriobacteriia bacterium]
MDEYGNGQSAYDPEGSEPTQQQPAQPTQQVPASQPGYQAGYERGARAGYEAGYHAGQTGAQAPAPDQTAQRPSVGDGEAEAVHAAWGTGSVPPVPGQEPGLSRAEEPKHKKEHKGVKSLVLGIAGGVIGAGLLTGALYATGVIGAPSTTYTTGSSQSITINPSDEDTSTAKAVAAKTLSSVATVNVTSSSSEGLGSGVIYDTDGHIITNYHVIDGAESITVTIDGTTYDAELVGSDASSDLAVLKADLNGASVTPMEVGDSSEVQVGDWVMTVGSPFGLEQSVSQGIVSALTRNTYLTSTSGNTLYTNLIQVDAAINPGNSGGALVDSEGKLIGICTLYTSSTESFAGIGFAIPGNYAVQVAQKIINGETVTHAHIGVSMQTVNEQNAKANKLSVTSGAYVADVTESGPAANAGIQKGDIITAIDGVQMSSADDVILAVRSHNIGDTVKVTVMRKSQEMSFDVTLDDDAELQKQQEEESNQPTSNINEYLNNNDTNSDSDDSTILQQFQEYMNQRNNGYGNGYGYNGYGN